MVTYVLDLVNAAHLDVNSMRWVINLVVSVSIIVARDGWQMASVGSFVAQDGWLAAFFGSFMVGEECEEVTTSKIGAA